MSCRSPRVAIAASGRLWRSCKVPASTLPVFRLAFLAGANTRPPFHALYETRQPVSLVNRLSVHLSPNKDVPMRPSSCLKRAWHGIQQIELDLFRVIDKRESETPGRVACGPEIPIFSCDRVFFLCSSQHGLDKQIPRPSMVPRSFTRSRNSGLCRVFSHHQPVGPIP
jgi:hypothetical protein